MTAALVAAALCGCGGCALLHIDPHVKEMLLAAVVATACAGGAMALPILASHATQPAKAQTALLATVAHLFGCLLLAAAVMLARIASPVPMLLWMLPMYWATLIGLVVVILRMVNPSPAAQK